MKSTDISCDVNGPSDSFGNWGEPSKPHSSELNGEVCLCCSYIMARRDVSDLQSRAEGVKHPRASDYNQIHPD